MQPKQIRGFKVPKTMESLADLAVACGSHWRYPGSKVPSYMTTTLQPYEMEKKYVDQVKSALKIWTELLIKLSEDIQLIEKLHQGYTQDQMIGKLLSIAKKLKSQNNKVANFFLIRFDFMFDDEKKVFQQTEFNAIAPGCFALSQGVIKFHKCLQHYRENPSNILCDPPKANVIQAFKRVHNIYQTQYNTKAAFLIVAEGNDNDSVEQAQIQKQLLLSGIQVVKASMKEIGQTIQVSSDELGTLKVKGQQISVVYYRQGFSLKQYDFQNGWQVREKMDLSRAITCPNPFIQLLNFKNIQTKLKTTNVINDFLSEREAKLIHKLQTTMFTIEEIRDNREKIVEKYGNNLVVKSIHEASGENYFNQEAIHKIRQMKPESIIVMELIKSKSRPVQLLGQQAQLIEFNGVSEVGFFNCAIYKDSKDIQTNEYLGYLIRTLEEGGKGQKQVNYKRKGYDALAII